MRISDWSSDVCSSDLISAFDQHLCRTVLCARMLAAHNAANIMDRLAVGDDSHAVIQPVGLAVKGKHFLTRPGLARDEPAFQRRHVIDMQRTAKVDHDEIDRKSTRLNYSHSCASRMPSSA